MIVKSTQDLFFANELFSAEACKAAQVGLELLGSSNPLLLASWVVETTGIHQWTWLSNELYNSEMDFLAKEWSHWQFDENILYPEERICDPRFDPQHHRKQTNK